MNMMYIPSVYYKEQKIIPSNIFELGSNRYLLLDIQKDLTTNEVYLHIIGTQGSHCAREFTFALKDLASPSESLSNA